MGAPGFQFTRYHGTDKKGKTSAFFKAILSVFFKTTLHHFVIITSPFQDYIFLSLFLGKKAGL